MSETAEDRITLSPWPGRVRVSLGDAVIAESDRAVRLEEKGHRPVAYLPREDVNTDLLSPSDTTTRCPWKGHARYWSITAGGTVAQDAVWSYEDPIPAAEGIRSHMAFYPGKVTIEA